LISNDNGQNWISIYPAGEEVNGQWGTLAISSDANVIMTLDGGTGLVYCTNDGGATWLADASLGAGTWRALALNNNGTRALAVADYVFLGVAAVISPLYVESSGSCGGKTPCYATIQAALNAAADGAVIMVGQGIFTEAPVKNTAGSATISGGWNSTFTSQTAKTTSMKAPRAPQGAVILQEVVVIP
jgi:hypothetical protein